MIKQEYDQEEYDRFQKMIIHTLNRYLGPAAIALFTNTCKQIGTTPYKLNGGHMDQFALDLKKTIHTLLEEWKANQLLGVLKRLGQKKVASYR